MVPSITEAELLAITSSSGAETSILYLKDSCDMHGSSFINTKLPASMAQVGDPITY